MLLRNTSACAHPTNATVHVQMATSENEVNAPTSVCWLLLKLQVIDIAELWQTTESWSYLKDELRGRV